MSEIHLFIIWNKGLSSKDKLLIEFKNKFNLLWEVKHSWSSSNFIKNLEKFYSAKPVDLITKEKIIGNGDFYAYILEDLNPKYDYRITTSGKSMLVNINLFDLKIKYRNLYKGDGLFHASDNVFEAKRDIWFLYQKKIDYFQKKNKIKKSFSVNKNLVNFDGWPNFKIFFETLNYLSNYVVLRNFETFPKIPIDTDIDFLTDNLEQFIISISADKVFKEDHRRQYQIKINNRKIKIDVRAIGDNYYDCNFSKLILKNKSFNKKFNIFTPNNNNYYFSLLYHTLVHKQFISSDYYLKLNKISKKIGLKFTENFTRLKNQLEVFLAINSFDLKVPHDSSVFFNNNLLSDLKKWNPLKIISEKKIIEEIKHSFLGTLNSNSLMHISNDFFGEKNLIISSNINFFEFTLYLNNKFFIYHLDSQIENILSDFYIKNNNVEFLTDLFNVNHKFDFILIDSDLECLSSNETIHINKIVKNNLKPNGTLIYYEPVDNNFVNRLSLGQHKNILNTKNLSNAIKLFSTVKPDTANIFFNLDNIYAHDFNLKNFIFPMAVSTKNGNLFLDKNCLFKHKNDQDAFRFCVNIHRYSVTNHDSFIDTLLINLSINRSWEFRSILSINTNSGYINCYKKYLFAHKKVIENNLFKINLLTNKNKYINGDLMINSLFDILMNPGWTIDSLVLYFRKYLDIINPLNHPASKTIDGIYWDSIPQNIILDNEKPQFIDFEFTFKEKFTLKHLLFRAIFSSLEKVNTCNYPSEYTFIYYKNIIFGIFKKLKINLNHNEFFKFIEYEFLFQKFVRDKLDFNSSDIEHNKLNIAYSIERFDNYMKVINTLNSEIIMLHNEINNLSNENHILKNESRTNIFLLLAKKIYRIIKKKQD